MLKMKSNPFIQSDPEDRQCGWNEWRDDVSILAQCRGDVAFLPSGYPLRRATFTCRGGHLIVQGPECPEIVVSRFFNGGGQTTLATVDGVEVYRHRQT